MAGREAPRATEGKTKGARSGHLELCLTSSKDSTGPTSRSDSAFRLIKGREPRLEAGKEPSVGRGAPLVRASSWQQPRPSSLRPDSTMTMWPPLPTMLGWRPPIQGYDSRLASCHVPGRATT